MLIYIPLMLISWIILTIIRVRKQQSIIVEMEISQYLSSVLTSFSITSILFGLIIHPLYCFYLVFSTKSPLDISLMDSIIWAALVGGVISLWFFGFYWYRIEK